MDDFKCPNLRCTRATPCASCERTDRLHTDFIRILEETIEENDAEVQDVIRQRDEATASAQKRYVRHISGLVTRNSVTAVLLRVFSLWRQYAAEKQLRTTWTRKLEKSNSMLEEERKRSSDMEIERISVMEANCKADNIACRKLRNLPENNMEHKYMQAEAEIERLQKKCEMEVKERVMLLQTLAQKYDVAAKEKLRYDFEQQVRKAEGLEEEYKRMSARLKEEHERVSLSLKKESSAMESLFREEVVELKRESDARARLSEEQSSELARRSILELQTTVSDLESRLEGRGNKLSTSEDDVTEDEKSLSKRSSEKHIIFRTFQRESRETIHNLRHSLKKTELEHDKCVAKIEEDKRIFTEQQIKAQQYALSEQAKALELENMVIRLRAQWTAENEELRKEVQSRTDHCARTQHEAEECRKETIELRATLETLRDACTKEWDMGKHLNLALASKEDALQQKQRDLDLAHAEVEQVVRALDAKMTSKQEIYDTLSVATQERVSILEEDKERLRKRLAEASMRDEEVREMKKRASMQTEEITEMRARDVAREKEIRKMKEREKKRDSFMQLYQNEMTQKVKQLEMDAERNAQFLDSYKDSVRESVAEINQESAAHLDNAKRDMRVLRDELSQARQQQRESDRRWEDRLKCLEVEEGIQASRWQDYISQMNDKLVRMEDDKSQRDEKVRKSTMLEDEANPRHLNRTDAGSPQSYHAPRRRRGRDSKHQGHREHRKRKHVSREKSANRKDHGSVDKKDHGSVNGDTGQISGIIAELRATQAQARAEFEKETNLRRRSLENSRMERVEKQLEKRCARIRHGANST